MQLNHVANRVDMQFFETIVTMFQDKLGFVELRRTERAIWLRQPGFNIDLQFCRSDSTARAEDRRLSQVAFLSDTPKAALEDLAAWLGAHGIEASVGSFSPKEFYLDAPTAFVDFVIEAMLPEMADYPVAV